MNILCGAVQGFGVRFYESILVVHHRATCGRGLALVALVIEHDAKHEPDRLAVRRLVPDDGRHTIPPKDGGPWPIDSSMDDDDNDDDDADDDATMMTTTTMRR